MKKRFAGFGRRANSPKEKTKKAEEACGKRVGEESRNAEIPRTEILPAPDINPFSGNHYEHGEELIFTDPETKKQKTIVSKRGCFCNFPGVEDYPDESSEVRGHMAEAAKSKKIRFCAYFEPFGKDQYVVWWMIWPDGRYWEDEDGFGGTNDEEIELYALMDRHGCYTTPFRLRNVGMDYYAWGRGSRYLRFQRSAGGVCGFDLDRVDRKTDLSDAPIRQIPRTHFYRYGRNTGFKIGNHEYSSVEQLTETLLDEKKQIYKDCHGNRIFHMTVSVSREGESILELRNGGMPQYMAEDTPLPYKRHYYYMLGYGPALHCVYYTENKEDLYVKEDMADMDEDSSREMQYLGILPYEDTGIFPDCF